MEGCKNNFAGEPFHRTAFLQFHHCKTPLHLCFFIHLEMCVLYLARSPVSFRNRFPPKENHSVGAFERRFLRSEPLGDPEDDELRRYFLLVDHEGFDDARWLSVCSDGEPPLSVQGSVWKERPEIVRRLVSQADERPAQLVVFELELQIRRGVAQHFFESRDDVFVHGFCQRLRLGFRLGFGRRILLRRCRFLRRSMCAHAPRPTRRRRAHGDAHGRPSVPSA